MKITTHKVIFGNSRSMEEIPTESVHLVVSSPPYFNAPFDYKDLFPSYSSYLEMLTSVALELYRVLQQGRIVAFVIDDTLVNGEKFPIVSDVIQIFLKTGFLYRERIIWKKPDGYIRISRRSGVLLKNPYPMYFYPDNLLESILLFQKGKFDYRSIPKEIREESRINLTEFQEKKWYRTIWEIINTSPNSPLDKGIASFPEEIPYRLITLFSYVGETVLDPFLGSGTTMKVSLQLNRNSIGIEQNENLEPIIQQKVNFPNLEIIRRR